MMNNVGVNNTLKKNHKELYDSSLLHLGEELDNSMTNLLGYLQLFKCNVGKLTPEQREQLNSVSDYAKHLMEITETIEDIIKCKYGLLVIDGHDFSMYEMLQKILIDSSSTALKRHLVLSVSLDEQLGIVRGDEKKIKKIIQNLIHNLIVFTEADQEIGVNAHAQDGQCELKVWNKSAPLVEELLDRLFLPPIYSDNNIPEHNLLIEHFLNEKGAGFLLAKEIIELHNGSLSVTTSYKKKNCILITLPVSPECRMAPKTITVKEKA